MPGMLEIQSISFLIEAGQSPVFSNGVHLRLILWKKLLF
jgi:hypothetical protein